MDTCAAVLAERLEQLETALPGSRGLVEPWLRAAPDEDVFRACPIKWAAAREIDLDEAVGVLLHAASVGLVRIGWELACPGCGLNIDVVDRLDGVGRHLYCGLCARDQRVALDDWIQVTFTVRSDVRFVRYHEPDRLPLRDRILWCEASGGVVMRDGEPLRSYMARRIYFCDFVEPGEAVTARVHAEEGALIGCPRTGVRLTPEAPGPAAFELVLGADGTASTSRGEIPPGDVEVTIRNEGSVRRELMALYAHDFHRFGPPSGYSAAQLIHHPVYAELFPAQLACSGGLAIRDVTLLFSDVVGSTAMYRDLGDLRAYERVREHFAAVAPVVARHDGLWVKDIGDAVMASFQDPCEAVAAAIEMHRAVRNLCGLEIKIGVHCGSCIAVSYRGRLDWFGSTVNVAARVQSLAGPGEICLSDVVLQRSERSLGTLRADAFDASVRGISEPIRVHRILVPS